eukprot:SAG22_NODE_19228_length_277_cov_0.578652_2_plen_25_part_01
MRDCCGCARVNGTNASAVPAANDAV